MAVPNVRRELLRLAQKLYQEVSRPRAGPGICLPEWDWDSLVATHRMLSIANQRGWQASVKRLSQRFDRQAFAVITSLEVASGTAESLANKPPGATLSEIYADLQAIQEEFEDFCLDSADHELSATTEAIILEGVHLGRFRIVLDLRSLHGHSPYSIKPLDRNADSSIPHPHVKDRRLCEGEGQATIRKALDQRRFYDFFLLVQQVLKTYNPTSAYAKLSRWNGGFECPDCGTYTTDEDASSCERCQAEVCVECTSSCTNCGVACCSDCYSSCHACHRTVCSNCRETCCGCFEPFCPSCVRSGLCHTCETQRKDHSHHDLESSAASAPSRPSADTEFQPVRVGQAVVPA